MRRLAEMAGQLGRRTEEQRDVLDRLGRLAPAVQEMAAPTLERFHPLIGQAIERNRQRLEQVAARRHEADRAAATEELRALRMLVLERAQRAGSFCADPAREKQWEV